ncbi:helix-turn-helix domain-containing protein [Candidatus Sulfidibacterium hydrothermale]|uniref:helix-turn-helix domain-containing protein n=1 Tax=Candidatus Sulfidibacterium hydrothermale TaxID=2875962 RepID=UPI001F0A18B7|nr:helix-turn-helix domain-containing protein [Candidatus Sulfidibacterium hydrothermale]UBM63404.1 helix-turn-helix domain-containing protein [Candidatus Sulfidibacterium hydrothermale]
MEINYRKIKELRTQKGFSQEALAEKSGLSLRTVQRIENGETFPRGDSLKRMASALDVLPETFIHTENRQKNDPIITTLQLSQFGFLLFPPLSILIPLWIWIKEKESSVSVENVGKSVLNFQISWNILLLFLFIFFFISMATRQPGDMLTFKQVLSLPFIVLLYIYNFGIIIINIFLYKKKEKVRYFPAIRFFN